MDSRDTTSICERFFGHPLVPVIDKPFAQNPDFSEGKQVTVTELVVLFQNFVAKRQMQVLY